MQAEIVTAAGIGVDCARAGAGTPLLYLHGHSGIEPEAAFLEALSGSAQLLAPSLPGFGRSGLPDWLDSIDDVSYVMLEVLDRLGLARVALAGSSVGGWVAAAMAVKSPERFSRIALIAPAGIKVGPVDRLGFPDIFAMSADALRRTLFHNPERGRVDAAGMTDEELGILVRNRETLTLLTWEPYMHDPKLRRRLGRVTAPVLLLRGGDDRFVAPDYMDAFAALLPDARMASIDACGHAAAIEQPAASARAIADFLGA